jgi:hypothetical protein
MGDVSHPEIACLQAPLTSRETAQLSAVSQTVTSTIPKRMTIRVIMVRKAFC